MPGDEPTRRRPPQKKKPEPERDRIPKIRPREEEDDLAQGNWRQWIEEEDDDTRLPLEEIDEQDVDNNKSSKDDGDHT